MWEFILTYFLYLLRWQASTPILAIVISLVNDKGFRWKKIFNLKDWKAAAIANLIGGLIFFWIDRLIFSIQ